MEKYAFQKANGYSKSNIKDIVVNKKSKTYARDAQCIYEKKSKKQVVGINKKKEFVFSKKVKKQEGGYSVVGINSYSTNFKKIVYPVCIRFGENATSTNLSSSNIYFKSKKVPKYDKVKNDVSLPIFCTIHVPKKGLKSYKKLYKKCKQLIFVDKWKTF